MSAQTKTQRITSQSMDTHWYRLTHGTSSTLEMGRKLYSTKSIRFMFKATNRLGYEISQLER